MLIVHAIANQFHKVRMNKLAQKIHFSLIDKRRHDMSVSVQHRMTNLFNKISHVSTQPSDAKGGQYEKEKKKEIRYDNETSLQ